MVYWKRNKTYKRVSTTGRRRKIGNVNYTDRSARRLGRPKRSKNYVNNPDISKKGSIRKNYRRRKGFTFLS